MKISEFRKAKGAVPYPTAEIIDLIAGHIDELAKPIKWAGPAPTEKELAAALVEPLQFFQSAVNAASDDEKKVRIKYQGMAYEAMSFIDQILGLCATKGTGTTVDSFEANLQKAKSFLFSRLGLVGEPFQPSDHPSTMSAAAIDSGAVAEADKGMRELKEALDAKHPLRKYYRSPHPRFFHRVVGRDGRVYAINVDGTFVTIDSADEQSIVKQGFEKSEYPLSFNSPTVFELKEKCANPSARPQCQPVGSPAPETWDDYELICRKRYCGKYNQVFHEGFDEGVATVFNMLRSEFKSPAECRK